MHTRAPIRHVEIFSISGSRDRSLVNVVHESSISSVARQGESVEVCRSSCECGSCSFGSYVTSEEVERFLTTTKIHSS